MSLPSDFKELLSEFAAAGVEYLLVGGYAVVHYSRPRFTKDIDLWVSGAPENLARVAAALEAFGAPRQVCEHVRQLAPTEVVFFGSAPARVDILRDVEGIRFEECYPRRVEVTWDGVPISVIAMDDLIANKTAVGRPQDLIDVQLLRKVQTKRRP
jgi:hypothetical protein